MPKKHFTTVRPLPSRISRKIALETLQDDLEMIDLNPSHTSRHSIDAPKSATPEEYFCRWYQITDHITMCPGLPQKSVTFNACFHNIVNGSQIHCYAPMGLDIKQKWTIGGNAPGEPVVPAEIGIGAPVTGLYIREDVELKCNFLILRFVRRTLKAALEVLVARLMVKAELLEATQANQRLEVVHPTGHRYIDLASLPSPVSPLLNTTSYQKNFRYCIDEHQDNSDDNERKCDTSLNKDQRHWLDGTHLNNGMTVVELP